MPNPKASTKHLSNQIAKTHMTDTLTLKRSRISTADAMTFDSEELFAEQTDVSSLGVKVDTKSCWYTAKTPVKSLSSWQPFLSPSIEWRVRGAWAASVTVGSGGCSSPGHSILSRHPSSLSSPRTDQHARCRTLFPCQEE